MAPTETAPAPEAAAEAVPGGARQTLATRIAERNRLRALRAERLARLHPGAPETVAEAVAAAARPRPAPPDRALASDAAQDALEHFLRALTGGLAAAPQAPPPEAAAVLHFQRPEPAAAVAPCDLGRLPGAGPDLVWALQRAGLCRLADLAPLAAEDLAARLGPLGRLVPTETWIAVAQAAGQER